MDDPVAAFETHAALEAYVVEQLAGGVKPQTVTFEVARRQGWDWRDAESFVNEVAELQSSVIQRRQRPLLRVMSGLLMAAGGLVLAFTAFVMLDYLAVLQQRQSDLTFLASLTSVLGMIAVYDLPQLLLGLVLVFAGLMGWWRTMPRSAPSELADVPDTEDPFSL